MRSALLSDVSVKGNGSIDCTCHPTIIFDMRPSQGLHIQCRQKVFVEGDGG